MKVKKEDLMVDSSQVYQKEFTGGMGAGLPHYNWICIATFHHLKGATDPSIRALEFYDAISENRNQC